MKNWIVSIFPLCLIVGCASVPQTESILRDRGQLPERHEILGLPVVTQSQNYCGPASLATVAAYAGLHLSADDLAPMMYTPGKRGTLQLDFIGAARRIGLLAVTITALRPVLTEVSVDHPVVVLLNVGSMANPVWHYAVISGFDLQRGQLTLHWGTDSPLIMDFAQFERNWKKADYWALLALTPRVLPATIAVDEILEAASALERVGKAKAANEAYQAILAKGPEQLVALFGLGNTFAALGQWRESAQAFEKASLMDPDSRAIWNNLAEVYLKLHERHRAAQARKHLRSLTSTGTEK